MLWELCTQAFAGVLSRVVSFLPLRSVAELVDVYPPLMHELRRLPEPTCDVTGCGCPAYIAGYPTQCDLCQMYCCWQCAKICSCGRSLCWECDLCAQCEHFVCPSCVVKKYCHICNSGFCAEPGRRCDLEAKVDEGADFCSSCGRLQCGPCQRREHPLVENFEECEDCSKQFCSDCELVNLQTCFACEGDSYGTKYCQDCADNHPCFDLVFTKKYTVPPLNEK